MARPPLPAASAVVATTTTPSTLTPAERRVRRARAMVYLEGRIAKLRDPSIAHAAGEHALPRAMMELGALYAESARTQVPGDADKTTPAPSIGLYRQVLREHPSFPGRAMALYLLGHAFNDAGRMDEAQQVWRSFVCHNHFAYPVPPDPKDPDRDTLVPKPQDNTREYWVTFRRRFEDPAKLAKPTVETTYVDIYPDTCVPAPMLPADSAAQYLAEAWWQIGNWESDERDLGAGVLPEESLSVWGLSRANSAFRHATQFPRSTGYLFVLYKFAWTLLNQQRYRGAVEAYVRFLEASENGSGTGTSGAAPHALDEAAFAGIAEALVNADFEGPRADAPFVARPHALDTLAPDKAESALRVAIQRVKDPNVLPQDRAWTPRVYMRLAQRLRELGLLQLASETFALVASKFALEPVAAQAELGRADVDLQLTFAARPASHEFDLALERAVQSAISLLDYVGDTQWTRANMANTESLERARLAAIERLRGMIATLFLVASRAGSPASTPESKPVLEMRLSHASRAYRSAGRCIRLLLPQAPLAGEKAELHSREQAARAEYIRIQGLLRRPLEWEP